MIYTKDGILKRAEKYYKEAQGSLSWEECLQLAKLYVEMLTGFPSSPELSGQIPLPQPRRG